ncbi:NUDIX domain-containing protein [Amycolatopsis thermoflava]|uniref:NUDIX domain-containing protein n=1 Tax=Amycolatopsis thermoflava TaxID=84480 RepID=UPI003EBC43CD
MSSDEMARLTADVVLLGERADGELCVLLVRRGWEPFQGCWALPGGHVDAGEDTQAAARRELAEETGLQARSLDLVAVYAAPGRDPRGRYVTFAYTGSVPGSLPVPTAGDDASEARWWSLSEVARWPERVAFDHWQIIADALDTRL